MADGQAAPLEVLGGVGVHVKPHVDAVQGAGADDGAEGHVLGEGHVAALAGLPWGQSRAKWAKDRCDIVGQWTLYCWQGSTAAPGRGVRRLSV